MAMAGKPDCGGKWDEEGERGDWGKEGEIR